MRDDDISYAPRVRSEQSANEVQASLARVKALKRRERWLQRVSIGIGLGLLALYLVLITIDPKLSLIGAVLMPLSAFAVGWGLLREIVAFMAER
ncbi:MAG: hypothetical protein GXY36_19130 [Chloroflexi bacterium]|nr:hypothetical protein [Chloroflexota bacterium]